jgi:MarR family transcriptional regulator, transcriptional regulator for hemolysin
MTTRVTKARSGTTLPEERTHIFGFGVLIHDLARLYVALFETHARELRLTLGQCEILALLSCHEGISQVRLSELSGIEPMALVRTLDRMQEGGWIERRPDSSDRRAHRLYLCAAADPIIRRMWEIADRSHDGAMTDLSSNERRQCIALLERVRDTLAIRSSFS